MASSITPEYGDLEERHCQHRDDDASSNHSPPLSASGQAACIARIHRAHARRQTIARELNGICIHPADMQCDGCVRSPGCDRMLSGLLIKLINAATDDVHEESALISLHRTNAAHGQSLAEHAASHERLINDLSAYVMDWGRVLPGDLIRVTADLLKYWTEAHFALHDGFLFDIASGTVRS